ncbi:hypothetical protein [Sporosarcina sp.]|uniref:hypothetical protein n=1 Tax=Sporosarcina sp. TaxID=49982 RepID=UPI00345C1A68
MDINTTEARQTRRVHAGRVFVNGLGVGDVASVRDVASVVLRDRRVLSEEGMLVILITVSKTDGQLISEPDTISRGFVYQRDAQELIKEVNEAVTTTVNNLAERKEGQ